MSRHDDFQARFRGLQQGMLWPISAPIVVFVRRIAHISRDGQSVVVQAMFGIGNDEEGSLQDFRKRHPDGYDLFVRLQQSSGIVEILRQLACLHFWESEGNSQSGKAFEVHPGEWLVFEPEAVPLIEQIMERTG